MMTGMLDNDSSTIIKRIKLEKDDIITNETIVNLAEKSKSFNPQKVNTYEQIRSTGNYQENVANIRPSEALFVRCLLPYCKRLAPLWFKGVSSMREKNREEHRRISTSTTCQNQDEWEKISDIINDMNESSETETVVNLLKKLYKELPTDSILWFIKCWLKFPETLANNGKCAFSRGDARGRMRRIDGGKGSDKVWRLDTIVGMMFHGMPMSSTDTNIMIHTCDQELCIRPQHLRFRASSVAFVAVLKALQQTGYSIIPPVNDGYSANGRNIVHSDEFVDLSGPFKIEQLQQYRLEDLKPYEQSMGKLSSSSSDVSILAMYPILKNYYPMYGDNFQKAIQTYTPRTNSTSKIISTTNDLNRSVHTASNSTDSPPQISDISSRQCLSPPHLSSVKSLNTEIAPTPRKVEPSHSYRNSTFRVSLDSPSSSSILSNDRDKETCCHAPILSLEELPDRKHQVSRFTNESPNISGSNTTSGKTTPRQPAKKRLEARTPTFMIDDQLDTFLPTSSPLDNKPVNSYYNASAFRVVTKKNDVNNDESTEVEVAQIFEPCHMFTDTDRQSKSEATNNDCAADSNGNLLNQHLSTTTTNETLTTPSPLDCLFMAISQSQTLLANGTCSPTLEDNKPPTIPNDHPMGCQKYQKSSSASAISCRFTPEQASALFTVIRNSPYGNNNPEIIDILFNMMQQYPIMCDGNNVDQYHRPDSSLLRCQIYNQLSNASPQFDCNSHSPLLNEIFDNESVSVRSSPFQNPTNKVVFNRTSNRTSKNQLFFTEN